MNIKNKIILSANTTLKKEINSIKTLKHVLDKTFFKAVEAIYKSNGRVIITGVGKSAHIGNKIAASEIAQIKVYAPNVALKIIDRAIQIHGGEGVSQLTPLASMYAHMRTLRLADGPDEVHRRAVARYELGKYMS